MSEQLISISDISIEALYIYVCMPIFIYMYIYSKEIQVCTDGVIQCKQATVCLYKVNGIMSVSSIESLAIFSYI